MTASRGEVVEICAIKVGSQSRKEWVENNCCAEQVSWRLMHICRWKSLSRAAVIREIHKEHHVNKYLLRT